MRSALLVLGLLVGLAAPSQAAETLVTILTGSTSGIYYPLGMALSSIEGNAIKGVSFSVQSTKGSVENLRLLESGDGEVGFALADTTADAWAGTNEAGFTTPFRRLRGVARIYPNYVQIVASKESGIKTLADLRDKRVSVGAEGSGTALNAAAILRAAGLTFGDLAKVDHTPFGTSARMVEQGALDATLQSAGLGVESVRHLLASGKTTLVPIPPEVVAKIGSPAYLAGTIPAGTYEGQPAEVPTAAIMNLLVTREGVSDDLVYRMTKSLFDHLDLLVQTHPAAKDIAVAKAPFGLPIPLHPGAERYYREIGLVR
jgi:TRAP transporter TAXI family solute receptor